VVLQRQGNQRLFISERQRRSYSIVLSEGGEVRREEPDTAGVSCEAMKNGVGDGHPVVGGSTATEFVENDEGARSRLKGRRKGQRE
jgi:hypothetical protein